MFTCELDRASDTALYLQLYAALKKDILCGKIKGQDKLPSKRELARHLNVSVITVQNAYEQLLAEGYISSQEKRGYYAHSLAKLPSPSQQPVLPSNFISSPFSPHTEFPFHTWAKIMRNVLLEKGEGLLAPLPFAGIPELRSAIAGYLYEFKGMNVSPEQIIIGAGTEYLYGLLIQLLGREKIYCLENPGYQKIGKIYRSWGVKFLPVNIDAQGVVPIEFKKTDAQILHVSPAHHYPTGIVMPITRRQELLAAVNEKEGYMIEDDYDSEFRFRGKPIPPIFSIDTLGRVIYINTFTKTIAPSIRISYMILPPALMKQYTEKLSFYSCTVPAFEQHTLARFIQDGYFERHINRTRKKLKLKRDAAVSFFTGKGIKIFEEDAGVHFLIQAKKEIGELISEAQKLGISITDIQNFFFTPIQGYENSYVVNYESMDLSRGTHPEAS